MHIDHDYIIKSRKFNHFGIKLLSRYVQYASPLVRRIMNACLVDLAQIVTENNYFVFDEKIFHQKLCTAMGTTFPSI